MQHFQVEHDFLKKKRWQHEQHQQRQLNLVKQHQLVLQEAVEKAKEIILQQGKALPQQVLKPDPETMNLINSIKSITYNHLAPLLDSIGILKNENELLLHQFEINR